LKDIASVFVHSKNNMFNEQIIERTGIVISIVIRIVFQKASQSFA